MEGELIQTMSLPERIAPQVPDSLSARLNCGKNDGQPLPETVRNFMEKRFRFDFSGVRIHTDRNAAEMAKKLNAQAFAYKNKVYFGAGRFNPDTSAGKRLLAHELAHLVQQRIKDPSKNGLFRKVVVEPTAAAGEISGYFNEICPAGRFNTDGNKITAGSNSMILKIDNSLGCDCLWDTVNDKNRIYTIHVRKEVNRPRCYPLYGCNNLKTWLPYPAVGPHSSFDFKHIYLPSKAGNEIEFGVFDPSGKPLYSQKGCPKWRLLAHELCGHCRSELGYQGSKGNRPGHDKTIEIENKIAHEEHGEPPRGLYNNIRQGESFHFKVGDRDISSVCFLREHLMRIVFKLVDGWHYEKPCLPKPPLKCIMDHFFSNSAVLSPQHRINLPEIAARIHSALKRTPGRKVSAVGHTDAPGTIEYNNRLGQKRARSVRAALGYYCVPWDRIITKTRGELERLVPVEGPEPRNRRVEIEIK